MREEAVRELSQAALAGMEGVSVPDLTVAEVISACFTLMYHITEVILTQSTPETIDHNKRSIEIALEQVKKRLHPVIN